MYSMMLVSLLSGKIESRLRHSPLISELPSAHKDSRLILKTI